MPHVIDISEELSSYILEKETQEAVSFILDSKPSNWTELSVNEFEKDKLSEYKNYSDAWIYSKKIQKDYFDFMTELWSLTWRDLISKGFQKFLQPVNFDDIEEVWEDGWHRHFKIKSSNQFDSLWFYCEQNFVDTKIHQIKLSLSLGKGDDYRMEGLLLPSDNWYEYDEEDRSDRYFALDCEVSIKNNQIQISDIDTLMKEAKDFLSTKVFKT